MLLFIKPLSVFFFVIYFLCGASDIADGYIARKTHTTSKAGAMLDSIADLVFVAVMLFVFIPLLSFTAWMIYWIAGIALIRLCSTAVVFVKYRTFAFLHTYANKAAGLILFCFPLLLSLCGINFTAYLIFIIANLSALEELAIDVTSKTLQRDIKSILK